MGNPNGKKKKSTSKTNLKHSNSGEGSSTRIFDEDMAVFIDMSRELKEEGNKLFQKKEFEGASLKYEKAIKLLPSNHIDMAYLHCNLAGCYMFMVPAEYERAIDECNLALKVSPKYGKALMRRAMCYKFLNKPDLAFIDVDMVLRLEPNNLKALENSEKLRKRLEENSTKLDELIVSALDSAVVKDKEKMRKMKSHKDKAVVEEDKEIVKEEKMTKKNHKVEDKAVVEEGKEVFKEENYNNSKESIKVIKLVFGEDIRWTRVPNTCSILQLREIVRNRFPNIEAIVIKYKDNEGDLVSITTTEELRWAEKSSDPQGSLRLYITEVNPEQDPLWLEEAKNGLAVEKLLRNQNGLERVKASENGNLGSSYIEDWIVQFAQLFKNHVGFSCDAYLHINGLGMKLYSEAMEDSLTSEEAQNLFDIAEEKFQEMTALALFNWGNVHMSRARKRLCLPEAASQELIFEQAKKEYEWALREYTKAGQRYKNALKIKPNFYEGLLALGQQQFEQAKLSWHFAVGSKVDLASWPLTEVLELFNHAEENMERGTEMWEQMEEQRLKSLSEHDEEKLLLQKMGLGGLLKEQSTDEWVELASNKRTQINLLWGTMLYERSVVEFKLELPMWEESLEAAAEKFKLAGASPTDLAVIVKNHCSSGTSPEGLGFKIDEIVQAWNEMYDAKRWIGAVSSFRLEPLFRRRVPKLHHILEHVVA